MSGEGDKQMPTSLQAALVPVLTAILTAVTVKLGLDPKSYAETIAAAAIGLSTLIIIGWGWAKNRAQIREIEIKTKKIECAETIAPGITTIAPGQQATSILIVNDPNTPDPPQRTENYVPKTP